jgi:hypothetical protein
MSALIEAATRNSVRGEKPNDFSVAPTVLGHTMNQHQHRRGAFRNVILYFWQRVEETCHRF